MTEIDTSGERAYSLEDVSVVMGTYDEEEAVSAVCSAIDEHTDGQAEIVCVDSSSDRTPEIAREHGARVFEQPPRGYGRALRAAIQASEGDVVITTDCDDTYPMDRIPDFLERINAGYDVVGGDRLYHGAETMPAFNRFGNRAFAAVASVLLGTRLHDTTTGMRAYHRPVLEEIEWTQNTGLSAELLLRPVARGYDVREEPIAYGERLGETKLDPLQGGAEILGSIVKVCAEERYRQFFG